METLSGIETNHNEDAEDEQDLEELNDEIETQFRWAIGILPTTTELLKRFEESDGLQERVNYANLLALRAEMAQACDSILRERLTRTQMSKIIRIMISHFDSIPGSESSVVRGAIDGLKFQIDLHPSSETA